MGKFLPALVASISLLHSAGAETPKPNIIIFLVDDMGVMDTSVPFLTDEKGNPKAYPLNKHYRTPNMERLAAQGIRFNQFSAMSVCSPTRVSIMTGQNSARHRVTNWINPDSNNRGPNGPPDWNWQGLKKGDVTLPSLLQSAGYRTIHAGKGHFSPRAFVGANPANLGFDVNIAGGSFGSPGSYYGKENYGNLLNKKNKKSQNAVGDLEKYHGSDTFLTDALTLEAKNQLTRSVQEKKPFFLYLAHYAVHAPFQTDPRFAKNYPGSKTPQALAFSTLIEGMDKSLGEIMDHVEKLGVGENTVLFFLGDNGSDAPLGQPHEVACAAPLRGKKGSHYEGGTRVPFIASWIKPDASHPGQKAMPITSGAIQNQMAAVYDLFPTVVQLAKTHAPSKYAIDGVPLHSLMEGKRDTARPENFLMHYPHAPHRSDYFTVFRNGNWKVVYHYFPTEVSSGSHYQLFNLATDPFEQNDLAATDVERVRSLMALMNTQLEEQKAVFPIDPKGKKPVKPIIP